ncbi:adrenodoxin [Aplochiton taeniatus]
MSTAPSSISTGNKAKFSSCALPLRGEDTVTVHFMKPNGERMTMLGTTGDSLLDLVIKSNLDLPGFGACDGTMACSTCHLIVDQEVFSQLGDPANEEMDMLDLSEGLCETSRLGCQVTLSPALEGMTVRVPHMVNDIRST